MRTTLVNTALACAAALLIVGLADDVALGRQGCVTGFNPPTLNLPASATSASFQVLTSTPTCEWHFEGLFLPTFEGIATVASGVGPGTVVYDMVLPNHSGPSRTKVQAIGGLQMTINQAANPCPLTLSAPSPATVPANGGTFTFTVDTTGSPCSYTTSPGSGLTIVEGGTGTTFPATVTVAVGPTPAQFAFSRFVAVSSLGSFRIAPHVGVIQTGPPIVSDAEPGGFVFAIHRGGAGGSFTTAAEPIRITDTENPTAQWTATATEPWIVVTPASGVAPATATIAIDPAAAVALTPNRHTGTIMLTSPAAPQSPRTIEVALSITDTSSVTSSPFGNLDIPVSSTTPLSGAIPMGGWVLDDVGIAKVQLYRSPVPLEFHGEIYLGDATRVRGARPDIARVGAFRPEATRAGWGFMLLSNVLPTGSGGVFELSAYAEDIEGHRTLLGRKTVTFDNASSPFPFGTIDVPTQGGSASGTAAQVGGWVLAQAGKSIPFDGSTIRLNIDGALQPHVATYGLPRPDVATYFPFPTYANANGPGAQFVVDTTQLTNGLHTVSWVAIDNFGVAQGIGSRFFTIDNGSGSQVTEPLAAEARSAAAVRALPQATGFVWNRRGSDERPWSLQFTGGRTNEIRQTPAEPLEVALDTWVWSKGCGPYAGYLMTGDVAGPLPPGASIDGDKGVFSWLPPAEFAGTFELVFVRQACTGREERIPLRVTIAPGG
jgi:hypothetical protein